MPFINHGSVRLHYEISGDTKAPCLVLANSLGTRLEMWQPQLQAFEENFCVLRYDMRGHGRSSNPLGPYTIAQNGGDLIALIDALEFARISFCGLSMGGAVGQWLAVHAPERLHCLVLCSTAAKFGSAEMWNSRIERVRSEGIAGISEAVLSRWFTAGFLGSGAGAVHSMRHTLEATDPSGYISMCEAIRDMDHCEEIKSIRTSTLILSGTYDTATTPTDAEALHQSIRDSQLIQLPAAHISNAEAPEQFTAAVMAFLETKKDV